MVITNKNIIDFLDDYSIIEEDRFNKDFIKTFSNSKVAGIMSGEFMSANYALIIRTPEHEVEFFLHEQDETFDIFIKDIVSEKCISKKIQISPLHFLTHLFNRLCRQTVKEMLLNLQ